MYVYTYMCMGSCIHHTYIMYMFMYTYIYIYIYIYVEHDKGSSLDSGSERDAPSVHAGPRRGL